MGMSLADLDEWDPNCVHAVFAALQSHADNTRDIADNLGRLIEGIPWEGDAHDAALAANKGIRDDMHLHAEQLEAVAKASKTAETEIRSIKADWAFLQQEASACGMTIDAGSGTVSYVKSSDPAVAHIQEENYQTIRTEVGKLLKRADQADHHLAAAINGAVGRMSAAGMNNEVSGQDIVGTPKDPGDQGGKLDQGGVAPVPAMTDVPGEPNSQPANLSGALDQLAGAPVPASVTPPPLPAKEVDAFKASARKVLASEGVPPEQIESRLSDVVARAQQQGWGPSYRPPKPERVPAPGFGEGFGDAWRKSEQSIKNLLGQGGPGAPGVLDSWKEMAKGINDVVTNPVGAAVGEIKHALASPSAAYYAGEKTFDVAVAAATAPFGGEAAAVRAGLPAELVTEGGAPLSVMRGWDPLGGMPATDFQNLYGTPEARTWPDNDGFPPGYIPQPANLPEGTIIDRFGSEYGRYLSPDGTPYGDRAITPETVGKDYNRYMITGQSLPPGWKIVEGPVQPWFGQTPSPGATQYMVVGPDGTRLTVNDLLEKGIIDRAGPPLGR